jgi:colanic acid biosynthesis glycosyl transferase WcaI
MRSELRCGFEAPTFAVSKIPTSNSFKTIPVQDILFLSSYYWPEEIGSAPYCTQVAEWIASKGHHVTVIASRPHYPNPALFPDWMDGTRDKEIHNGVTILRVGFARSQNRSAGTRVLNDIRFALYAAWRALRSDCCPSVIIACVPSCLSFFTASALKLRTNARVIGVVHDIESGLATSLQLSRSTLLRIICLVEKFAFAQPDRLIVLTPEMAQQVSSIGSQKIDVLPIWADLPPEDAAPMTPEPTLMYSGNFGKKQNLHQLLPLLEMLQQRLPEVKIVLQGDGSERTRLQARVSELKLRNTVFSKLVPAQHLPASLQSNWVHLVPQVVNTANFAVPSKVITIMAAGRPFLCIAEKGSVLHELAKVSQAGVCVFPGNTEQLFNSVRELISEPSRLIEMGRRGRDYVRRNLDRATILCGYETLILDSAITPELSKDPSASHHVPREVP